MALNLSTVLNPHPTLSLEKGEEEEEEEEEGEEEGSPRLCTFSS
jgi:hypothetical protein